MPGKETTEFVVNTLTTIVRKTGLTDFTVGVIIVVLHFLFGFLMLYSIYFCDVKSMYFIIGFITYLVVIAANYFFHGCIISRLEKALFSPIPWYGPPTVLRFLGIDIDKTLANQIIKYSVTVPAGTAACIKFFIAGYYIPAIFFTSVFTSLLFCHPQELKKL